MSEIARPLTEDERKRLEQMLTLPAHMIGGYNHAALRAALACCDAFTQLRSELGAANRTIRQMNEALRHKQRIPRPPQC